MHNHDPALGQATELIATLLVTAYLRLQSPLESIERDKKAGWNEAK